MLRINVYKMNPRLAVSIISIIIALTAGALPFTVFRADAGRYGILKGDTVIVDPVYETIGFNDAGGRFISDSISPAGYAAVYFDKTKRWNAVDSCGNLIFGTEGIEAPVLKGDSLCMKTAGNTYATAPLKGIPVRISHTDSLFTFIRGDRQMPFNNKSYTEITPLEGTAMLIVYDGEKFYVTDRIGHVMTPGYVTLTQIPILVKRSTVLLACSPQSKQLITSAGMGFSHAFDDIIPVYHDKNIKGFLLLKNDRWAYTPFKKINKNHVYYDYIDDFDRAGRAHVFYKGYRGTIDVNGNKIEEICGRLFRSGQSSDYTPEQKMAIYKEVVALAKDVNEDRYLPGAYMNIARLYEDAGDLGSAIDYYDLAASADARDAAENARRVRSQQKMERLSKTLDALNNLVSTLAGGTSNYMNNTFGAGSTMYGSSQASGSSLEGQYRNWERRARSIYESLTNTGYQTHEKGKASGGSTGRGMSGGNFVAQKRLLREAQSQMKNIRSKAAKQNISIPQSHYETINVNY